MQLDGKVALITGASSGIGEATARLFAQEGAHVGVLGRTAKNVEQVVEGIQSDGGRATPLFADVSNAEEMERAFNEFGEAQGRIDIVVANAGINGRWAPLEHLSVDHYRKTMDINFLGTFLAVKNALPHMKQHGGAMAVIASVNGSRMFSNTGASLYAASKAAQIAFVKMTAIELANYGIRINVVCPGAIKTEIDDKTEKIEVDRIMYPQELPEGEIPLTRGKPGSAHQVAQLLLFLTSGAASHITGTEVWIDGAESLFRG